MVDASPIPSHPHGRVAAVVCGLLIVSFVTLSLAAQWKKCNSVDELVYAVAGWTYLHTGDFRIGPEHPPLWKMWAALPAWRYPLHVDWNDPAWTQMTRAVRLQWPFSAKVAFGSPGNDFDAMIRRMRPMMVLIGAMLAAVLARWAWRLGGVVAAVVASALLCFDPSFLAHTAQVTNDVPVTFALTLGTYATWRLGRRFTVGRLVLLAVACGLCLNTKMSGVLIFPLVMLLLAVRAATPLPWDGLPRWGASAGRRLGISFLSVVCCGIISCVMIWASYGFRYSASTTSGHALNVPRVLGNYARGQWLAEHPGQTLSPDAVAHWQQPISARAIVQLMQLHVLPEGWLFALLFSLQNTQAHTAYLLGRISQTGWWYYFPLAMLFKTPLATLAALVLAAGLPVACARRASRCAEPAWTLWCAGLPLVTFAILAMRTNLDLGLRYVLPLYPWMYLLTAVAAATAVRRWRRRAIIVLGVLGIGLVSETLAAFPNYLAFFNTAAGGERGGLQLLGDSNLDWGQDLPALRDWQAAHRAADLYLCYFGSADPLAYGIRYTPLPGSYPLERVAARKPHGRWTLAISATYLQGIYLSQQLVERYTPLAKLRPAAVLNGTIYLFDVNSSLSNETAAP